MDFIYSAGGFFGEMLKELFYCYQITYYGFSTLQRPRVLYWDKVRSFLDMIDIKDLHSPLPSSVSTFSDSSNCDLQPLSIGAGRWHVGDKTAQQILSVIQPNAGSENRRERIIKYLQRLIEYAFKTKVFPFGSVPLKTYLSHGDIDLTAVNYSISSDDLAAGICSLLENEARNNTTFQVKDVLCVPAQVRVVKCTVDGICVDISFNQTAGLYALYFLEQVDQSIGKDHLFKRSLILIKAWCYYESRLLGGYYGLISTYALETMVLHVINLFHSTLPCPLAVLQKFLEYYSTFEWNKYCVRVDGLVLISSLPEIVVLPPRECDDALLSDAFLKSYREATLSAMGMGVVGSKNPAFPVKFLNILDPLRDDNNLGRSVSKGNFHRIRSALSYGAQKLGDILMLPLENIQNGLEKYFKDTLERNGKGTRADVDVPVSAYGSETSSGNTGDEYDYLSGLNYGLWVHHYGAMYPIVSKTSESHQVWNNRWPEMVYNPQCDQNIYYGKSMDKSPPSSFDGVRSIIPSNAASVKEIRKSRGTGTFIPYLYRRLRNRRNIVSVANGEDNEAEKELECGEELESEKVVETVDSPTSSPQEANLSSDEGRNTGAFNYSIEEFPVLPGSKPIPIKVCLESVQVNDISDSFDSLEFGNFKRSPSISPSVSETGKQSDSDISGNLDLVGDPMVAISEGQESSKIEEIPLGLVQPPQLKDDQEFPPLSRSAEAVITIDKKEFPPLCAYSKSHKSRKGRKTSNEMLKEA